MLDAYACCVERRQQLVNALSLRGLTAVTYHDAFEWANRCQFSERLLSERKDSVDWQAGQ
jgi:hypothetical protein